MSTLSSKKKSSFDARKMWWIFAGLSSLIVAGLAFAIMQSVTAKEKYYILKEDIPARTEITAGMLEELPVQAGSTPPNSMNISDIMMGGQFAMVDMQAGDILTASTVGPLAGLAAGVPDDFVIASFEAEPTSAAAGNIKRGNYIDIIMIDEGEVGGETGASYAMSRALVIEAAAGLDTPDNPEATENGQTSDQAAESARLSGIPTVYTVALSPEDATRLAVLSQQKLFVVLSSKQTVEDENKAPKDVSVTLSRIWSEGATNAGAGTDNTFGAGSSSKKGSGSKSETVTETETETVTEEPSAPSEPSAPEESGE